MLRMTSGKRKSAAACLEAGNSSIFAHCIDQVPNSDTEAGHVVAGGALDVGEGGSQDQDEPAGQSTIPQPGMIEGPKPNEQPSGHLQIIDLTKVSDQDDLGNGESSHIGAKTKPDRPSSPLGNDPKRRKMMQQ